MNNFIAWFSLWSETMLKLSLFAFPLALMSEGCMLQICHIPEVPPHNTCTECVSDCHALLTRTRLKLDVGFFKDKKRENAHCFYSSANCFSKNICCLWFRLGVSLN